MWCSFKVCDDVKNSLRCPVDPFYKKIKLIVESVENTKWDQAKTLWILGILKMKVDSNYNFDCSDYDHSKVFEKYQQVYYECKHCMLSTSSIFDHFSLRNRRNVKLLIALIFGLF